MELAKIYEAYLETNKNYLDLMEQLVDADFEMLTPEVIAFELAAGKEEFEKLMTEADALEVTKEEEDDQKDLKYLLMDSLFLANDLAYFYKIKEYGRFKMRVLNAVNKRRRAEMFKESPLSGGSCPMDKM